MCKSCVALEKQTITINLCIWYTASSTAGRAAASCSGDRAPPPLPRAVHAIAPPRRAASDVSSRRAPCDTHCQPADPTASYQLTERAMAATSACLSQQLAGVRAAGEGRASASPLIA